MGTDPAGRVSSQGRGSGAGDRHVLLTSVIDEPQAGDTEP